MLLPTPPLSPPPLPDPVPTVSKSKVAKCVLPEVAATGSVVDAVGWVLAFLTCSLKLRKQLRLDERLWLAAARGDASLCERLIAKGADVTAESYDGGDDPRVYFKVSLAEIAAQHAPYGHLKQLLDRFQLIDYSARDICEKN